MTEMKSFVPGRFCWVEGVTPDVAATKKFYGPLMGWSWSESKLPDGGVYNIAQVRGKDIGGVYKISPDMAKMGVPPHWSVHVAVQDADAAATKAASLGATVVQPPFDVMDIGRMAVIRDPAGATFNVWQAKKHFGAGLINEPGAFDWFELMTPDPAKAATFYGKLFGWTHQAMDMPGGMKYTMCSLGETGVAGMMAPDPKMKAPPSWVVYFNVADVDRTVKNAKETGGSVLVPPTDIPGMVRFALLMDSQHAAFGVAKALK